jgi:hypothetical protein
VSATVYYDYLLPAPGACGSAAEGDMSKSYGQWTVGGMCLINAARAKYGRSQLATYPNLLHSSYAKASDISVCQPNPSERVGDSDAVHWACGRDPYYYFYWPRRCVGSPYSSGRAETWYIGSGALSTARAAVSGWLHSDLHRGILLDPAWTGQGVQYSGPVNYRGTPDTRIWINHLGWCG